MNGEERIDTSLSFMELMNRIIILEQEAKDMKIKIANLESLTPNARPKFSKKYMKLTEYLKDQKETEITMSFEDIEKVLGHKLPPSACKQPSFWANTHTHTNALGWISAGFEVSGVYLDDKQIRFCKKEKIKV